MMGTNLWRTFGRSLLVTSSVISMCFTTPVAAEKIEAPASSPVENSVDPKIYLDPFKVFASLSVVLPKYCEMPQVGVFGDTATAIANGSVYFKVGSGVWTQSPIKLSVPHALTRLPDGRWLILDTENHRLLQVDDLSGSSKTVVRTRLAGVKLKRPHNAVVDPETGYVYLVAGDRRLFRFKSLDGVAEVWTFTPAELGYARSVAWFDGHVHIIHSSRGEVLRIDDFARRRYTRFRSPRPKALRGATSLQVPESRIDFDAGALASTGLVLNDVQKSGGWYYGSNDFLVGWAMGEDTGPARLIRWRSWADFQAGRWQDLGRFIPDARYPFDPLVPYYITIRDGVLYTPLSASLTDTACEQGRILSLNLGSLPDR